jgi:hypothetical protein
VRRPLALLLALPLLVSVDGRADGPSHSALWGRTGEVYVANRWLPDFSWAGFGAGAALPHAKPAANVRDFGARGDGLSDDTAAFQRALESVSGVILVPRGRYHLAGQLTIRRSGTVLRGEGTGPSGTRLLFSSSLADLRKLAELPDKNVLSWSGGLIEVEPKGAEHRLTSIAAEAKRGQRRLRVADASSIHAGDTLVLRLSEDGEHTLERELVGESGAGTTTSSAPTATCASRVLDWTFRVEAVEGNEVIASQPLRTDIKPRWAPAIWQMPFVYGVGIEHLDIDFPITPYPGHHRERGFNAIDFHQDVVDSWISDVEIHNADSGILVGRRSKWITIDEVRLLSSRPSDAKGNQGHYGVVLSACSDVLATNLSFDAELVHELSVAHRASGNVFAGPVRGRRIDLDHHRDAPFENLFQDLAGDLHLQASGRPCYGPPAGARNTYWGLDSVALPPWLGSHSVVVGHLLDVAEQRGPAAWIERAEGLEPRDLMSAQRARRLVRERAARPGPTPAR